VTRQRDDHVAFDDDDDDNGDGTTKKGNINALIVVVKGYSCEDVHSQLGRCANDLTDCKGMKHGF
jgi:hypothetical protein